MSQDLTNCCPLNLPVDDSALTKRPTEAELSELLQPLVKWKNVALHLLPAEGAGTNIQIIAAENSSIADQKIALYTKWLDVDPSATWNKVIDALKKAEEITLAKNVADKISKSTSDELMPAVNDDTTVLPNTQQLERDAKHSVSRQDNETIIRINSNCPIKMDIETLKNTFASLVSKIKEQLRIITNNETTKLNEIASFIEVHVDLHVCLREVNDIDELFREIKPHFDFLNCELIEYIVKEFLCEHPIKCDLDKYTQELDYFLGSPTLLDLKSAIEEGLIPKQNSTDTTCKVVIKLAGRWGKLPFETFQAVIQYVFSKELLTYIDIKPGSICVTFLAPLSRSESIRHKATMKIDFMTRIGIIEMYVSDNSGDHQIMSPRDEYSVNFSQSLLDAAEAGDDFETSVLVKLGANVNYRSKNGRTALILASNGGHDGVIQLLISAGANVNVQDNNGYSALMAACESMHPNLVVLRYLLEAEADLDLLTNDGDTAFVIACHQKCQLEALKLLLRYHTLTSSKTLIAATTSNDHLDILKELLKYSYVYTDLLKALAAACLHGQSSIITALIQHMDPTVTSEQLMLFAACAEGDEQSVKKLLNENAHLINYSLLSPLAIASSCGHIAIVELFIEHQTDVNVQGVIGRTPLMFASHNGHYQAVELLLKVNADVNNQRKNGVTALMLASKNGHHQVVELLLKKHADANIQMKNGATSLMLASQNGHYQVAQLLIKNNANINLPMNDGVTALMLASQNGHSRVAALLIINHADVNIQREDGGTALMLASRRGNHQVVEVLLQEHVYVDIQDERKQTALMNASWNGHYQVVEQLLEKDADVNIQRNDGGTALIGACENGHHYVVESLLKAKADVNIQMKNGETALMLVSNNCHYEIIEMLLREHADVNITSFSYRETALMLASENGHYQVVELLLNEHANVNIQTVDRVTALMFASQNGHHQVVELLLKEHADVNIQTRDGVTALMLASQNGHYPIVELLLSHHANPNIKTKKGLLALTIASSCGYENIHNLLERHTDSQQLSKSFIQKVRQRLMKAVTAPFTTFNYSSKIQQHFFGGC